MKFSSNALLLFASLQGSSFVAGEEHDHSHEDCTHGKLFVSDVDSNDLNVYDLDADSMANLAIESTLQAPGGNGQILVGTGAGNVVSLSRGSEDQNFADGRVNFLSSGLGIEDHGDHFHVLKGEPSFISNAGFDCVTAVHVVSHDNKVAIHCDGSYDATPQINTTVWVVDETKMGGSESAIVFDITEQGSHHGVAVPVDDGHVLYSLATQDRISRVAGASSLPDTFVMVDYDNNVIHSLNDTSDPDTHCKGFHGSTAVENTFALACDATHGGIVVVEYDETAATYKSRALSYPLDAHRTGSFAESHLNSHIVGNFAGDNGEYHLMAFDPSATETLGDSHIQTLDVGQCAFSFEKQHGEHLLVWLPSGKLQVYELDPWTLVAEVQVIEGMLACTEASMIVGYGQAFIIATDPGKIYALDLSEVEDSGNIPIATTTLGYTPNSAVVVGLSKCEEAHHDHDHDEDHDEDGDGGSAACSVALATAGLVSVVSGFFLM